MALGVVRFWRRRVNNFWRCWLNVMGLELVMNEVCAFVNKLWVVDMKRRFELVNSLKVKFIIERFYN